MKLTFYRFQENKGCLSVCQLTGNFQRVGSGVGLGGGGGVPLGIFVAGVQHGSPGLDPVSGQYIYFSDLFSDLTCKIHTHFQILRQKWLKSTPHSVFQTKRLKIHTLWCCTHLYSLYRGVWSTPPPHPGSRYPNQKKNNNKINHNASMQIYFHPFALY